MTAAGERALVGVVPAREREARRRLFDALEEALPVRFEGREEGALAGLDAVIALGPDAAAEADGPPRLVARGEELQAPAPPATVALAESARLDARIRGARLTERWVRTAIAAPESAHALAVGPAGVLWALDHGVVLTAAAPADLAADEALRDRLVPGRCIALMALVHFLRRAAAPYAFAPPPLQAAFVIDDPNLHWPRYGHLDYGALIGHATDHGYHLAVAMVPLDGWLVHPLAARLFRDNPHALSILVHGNEHVAGELARPRTAAEGQALGVAALRRIAAFERRAGVPVCRVMAPPHERVSAAAARGLLDAGFEAISMSRPYPWLADPERSFLVRPREASALTGWWPADAVAGGLPVLLRSAFTHPREDLVLRAFLDQPLLLYGHHDDLAALDGLADAAAQINRLGDVAWRSVSAISRASAHTRREGSTLRVRPWTRRVEIEPPIGVDRLVIEPRPELAAGGEPIEVEVAGPGAVTVTLPAPPTATPAPQPRRAWPVARRLAGEGRDRMVPLLAALGRR